MASPELEHDRWPPGGSLLWDEGTTQVILEGEAFAAPTSTNDPVYKGALIRSMLYLGSRDDAVLYLGGRSLF